MWMTRYTWMFWGMAIQAFVVATLWGFGWLEISPKQQAISGTFFFAIVVIFLVLPKKDLYTFWNEQAKWSRSVFGEDNIRGPAGPLKHLIKEAKECIDNPTDLEEYADLLFLVFDSTRRAGFTLDQLREAAFVKLEKNKNRQWSKPTTDEPVEHVR